MVTAHTAGMNIEHAPAFVPHRLLEIVGDDEELFDDMLAEFQSNLRTYAADLRSARDRASWRSTAHRLKGAAQAVGAEAIAAVAVVAELAAPGDAALLARLDAEISRFSAR
jgi:HPt (histidine-containing phosphotransfer) domain-containing protein